MGGAIAAAEQLAADNDNYLLLQQFANPANPEIHRTSTAEEIWADTDGEVDIVIAGVSTGGTITGVGRVKSKNANPASKSSPGTSRLTGKARRVQRPGTSIHIGAGFVPDIPDTDIYDEIITITADDASTTPAALPPPTKAPLVGILLRRRPSPPPPPSPPALTTLTNSSSSSSPVTANATFHRPLRPPPTSSTRHETHRFLPKRGHANAVTARRRPQILSTLRDDLDAASPATRLRVTWPR